MRSRARWAPLNHAAERSQVDITPKLPSSAYCAGLFDGEGYVGIIRRVQEGRRPRCQLVVAVQMVDREPLDALQAAWGGAVYAGHKGNAKRSPTFQWRIGDAAAVPFLSAIRPWLLISRARARVDLALAYQEQKAPRGGLGRKTPDSYRARQDELYRQMRALNQRQFVTEEAA